MPHTKTELLTRDELAHEILALKDAAEEAIGAWDAMGHQSKIWNHCEAALAKIAVLTKERDGLIADFQEWAHTCPCGCAACVKYGSAPSTKEID
jgi:hypothetical protein